MKLLLLALALIPPCHSQAADHKAAWRAVMEHAVANQPGRVGARAYASAFGVKAWTKEGKELARAAKRVKEWPVITVEGEALVFTERGSEGVRLELVNAEGGDFRLGGKPFHVDTDRPLLKQIKEALAAPETTQTAPFFELIPSAHAAVAGSEALAPAIYPVVSGVGNRDIYRKLASDPDLRRRVKRRPDAAKEPRPYEQVLDTEGLGSSAR